MRDEIIFLHKRVVSKREELWKKLNSPDFLAEWFINRIKPHMWSIDEIYRHMLASEIFYIHSKFGERRVPEEWGVGAQWVGDKHFGLKEKKHFSREWLYELTKQIENETVDYLAEAIANVACILNPEMIILGGGLTQSDDLLLQPIRERVRRVVPFLPTTYRRSLAPTMDA